MKNYLLTLLFVSAITGGLCYLSSGSFYEKQLRYLSMLLTLLALLSPLPTLFSSFDGTVPKMDLPSDQFASYGALLKEATEERINEQLSEEICRICNLKEEEFEVNCVLNLDEERSLFSMEEIKITMFSLSAVAKREQIREIVSKVGGRCLFIAALFKNGENRDE